MRTRKWGFVLLLALVFSPSQGLLAQERTTAGVVGGMTSSRLIWGSLGASEAARGILLGIYLRVPTPIPHLAVRAEAAYAQRGGLLSERELQADQPLSARVRGDYLSFPVHAEVSWEIGPIRIFAFGGPTVEQTQNTKADASVVQIMGVERATVFGLGYGAGVGGLALGSFLASVEVRGMEGISEPYDEGSVSIRNRSFEVLLRVGVPINPGTPDL